LGFSLLEDEHFDCPFCVVVLAEMKEGKRGDSAQPASHSRHGAELLSWLDLSEVDWSNAPVEEGLK
jgi:hypothetical protein